MRRFTLLSGLVLAFGLVCTTAFAAPEPVGLWTFESTENPLAATVGASLELVGEHEPGAGPGGRNGARIGLGSHYKATHGIAPNGGGELVNQYTLVLDIRTDLAERFTAILQTDPANELDNVCEMMSKERAIGIGATGYSRVDAIPVGVWCRVAIVVDNAAGVYDIHVDGERVLHGMGQPLDGRYALHPEVLFFADDDGDDNPLEVALIALFDKALDDAALGAFDAAHPLCPNAPDLGDFDVNDELTAITGEEVVIGGLTSRVEDRPASFRLDWGNGVVDGWSDFFEGAEGAEGRHSYALPGEYEIKFQIRLECGWVSDWIAIAKYTVEGFPQHAVLTRPFLQNVDKTSITVMWEANADTENILRYLEVTDGTPKVLEATGEARYSGHRSFIYTAHLEDLKPGTDYRYEVVLGESFIAGTGQFRTAPKDFEAFSFGVWGDSQGENKGAYEDDPLEPTISMMTHMANSGVNFGMGAGDHAEDGNDYDHTRRFYLQRVAEPLGRKAPFFIAWGNHDSYQNAVMRRFAHMPSADRKGFDPGYGSFAFTYADCRFIAIDYASMHVDIAQWLEGELKSPASQEARHRFLFIHVPPYCQLWIDGSEELRTHLVPLLEEYKVEAVFSGHTHAYERGYKNGVNYVITGGGSWLDHGEEVVKEWPHMRLGGPHPVGENGEYEHGLINEYVRVSVTKDGWTAECHAFEPDGSYIGVIDTFSNTDPNLEGLPAEDDDETDDASAAE